MSHNPCHHDCTDFPESEDTDLGCCAPYPLRKTCEAPAIPTNDCDEADPVVEYDPETEGFTLLSVLYDSNCSALLDSASSQLTGLIT